MGWTGVILIRTEGTRCGNGTRMDWRLRVDPGRQNLERGLGVYNFPSYTSRWCFGTGFTARKLPGPPSCPRHYVINSR